MENEDHLIQQNVLRNVIVGRDLSIGNILLNIINLSSSAGTPANPSSASVDRRTWLDVEFRRSRARCISRWQGAGVSEEDAIALADNPSIGTPPSNIQLVSGKLIILVGEMGAGKSLIVERLFQTAIRKAEEDVESAIPVFLNASDLRRDRSLEQAVQETTLRLCDPSTHPTLVVIDGVDEKGASHALWVLGEARLLVQMGWPITIVVASRPIPEFVAAKEAVQVPLLSRSSAEALVSQLAGRRIYGLSHKLTASVQEAIHRPLFAVLLGTYLREHDSQLPASKDQLLSDLVERSLNPLGDNVIQAKQLLERIAVASVDQGGANVPVSEIAGWAERGLITNSRLVIEEGGQVRFPLAVLTEWFAAQSLDAGDPSPEAIAADNQRLERWQYPLVLATATLSVRRVSEILTPIVEKQPAIAAAIINEALAEQGFTLDMPSLSVLELGRQVRAAMQAWVIGLGELASTVTPMLSDGALPTIGIRLSEQDIGLELSGGDIKQPWIDIGWHSSHEMPDEVVELPPGVGDSELWQFGWNTVYGSGIYEHPSWAWQWSHEKIADSLSRLLRERSLPMTSGLVSLEAAWYAASTLMGRNPSNCKPMTLDELSNLLGKKPSVSRRMRHALAQLEVEIEAAQSKGLSDLEPPEYVQAFRSTNHHSPEVILAYTENVYREAVKGYEYLVNKWFPKFTPFLSLASILPAQVVGVVVPPSSASRSLNLGFYWEALPYGSSSGADFSLSSCPLTPEDPRYEIAVRQMQVLRPKGLLYPSLKVSSIKPFTARWLGECPTTELAYQWLWKDLKKMGWVEGELGDVGYPYWR